MPKIVKKTQGSVPSGARGKHSRDWWTFPTAKTRLSELLQKTRTEGVQSVVAQGEKYVTFMDLEWFVNLIAWACLPKHLLRSFDESRLQGNLKLKFNEVETGWTVDLEWVSSGDN
jgi:hypothetical protein